MPKTMNKTTDKKGEKQITIKIKVRQRLEFFKIGKEAGLNYVCDVIDLLLHRYRGKTL